MGTTAHVAEIGTGHIVAPVRVRLPAWKPDDRVGKKPEGDWHDLPAGFLGALRTTEKFASRHPSAGAFMGVMLDGCHAYATNNTVIVEIDIGGPVPSCVIPLGLARLLIKRAVAPCAMLARERAITFAWDDSTWIEYASRHEVPAVVPAKFAEWREPEWQIPASWKKEFRAAAGMGGETIIISPNAIITGFGQSEFSCEAETPVEDATIWSRTVLAPVIKIAERIDFTSHPNGGCFAFPSGRGLVAGKV